MASASSMMDILMHGHRVVSISEEGIRPVHDMLMNVGNPSVETSPTSWVRHLSLVYGIKQR